jgi:HlyD family secretion protein
MKKSVLRIAVIAGALLVVAMVVLLVIRKPKCSKYKTAVAAFGDVAVQVSATGTLSAVNQVTVGSQVSGLIDTIMVDYNDYVKSGQVLARIDPRSYQAALIQAKADLVSAQVSCDQAQRNWSHSETLAVKGLASDDQVYESRTAYRLARAKLDEAQGNYDQAATNLAYTTITAPMSGIVISREVDPGQTVAASFTTPELFVIADLSRMQVKVSIDEADIGKLDTNLTAEFTVDAFPDRSFQGRLIQIRKEPVVTSNVVTYIGIVRVDNPDRLLLPGMTAEVKITAQSARNVLIVPNTTLNAKLGSLIGLTEGPSDLRPRETNQGPNPDSSRLVSTSRAPSDMPGGPKADSGHSQPLSSDGDVRQIQTVYLLDNGKPVPLQVEIGISDGYNTEVKRGLSDGDLVVVGLGSGKAAISGQQQTSNRPPMMGMGGPPPP